MAKDSFWDRSWDGVDHARVAGYLAKMDDRPDRIMEILRGNGLHHILDAGCGCGAYAQKLRKNGFHVKGFDVAASAVRIAEELFEKNGWERDAFRTADVTDTGYDDEAFDAVVSRDVIDHIPLRSAMLAIGELLRVTKKGGAVIVTVDASDEEYESEPHEINRDGDYIFTGGKWKGMTFHPYREDDIARITDGRGKYEAERNDEGYLIVIRKR